MIRAYFFHNADQQWLAYRITGHAGYAAHGSDIVCAAVSALAIATANSLERLAQCQLQQEVAEQEGGYLLMALQSEPTSASQLLLTHLADGLTAIAAQYPDHLQVIFEESVHK